MAQIIEHRAFKRAIIFFIVTSTITLAFESPTDDQNSTKMMVLKKIDIVMSVIFTIEAICKITALGFLLNNRQSYLRDSCNLLDLIIVVSGLLSFVFDSNLGFFKVLRIMHILRPLRLITRVKGLKTVITSLFNALPQIFKLQLVVLFFMYSFTILMTTLFFGKLNKCNLSHVSSLLCKNYI